MKKVTLRVLRFVLRFVAFVGIVVVMLLSVCVFSLLLAIPVMYLWNAVVPAIFGLPAVSALQMWGILWLCFILFGRVRGGSKK